MARLPPYLCLFVFFLAVQCDPVWPVVKFGNKGHNVAAVQYLLRAHGHFAVFDGRFGPQTRDAVRAFQAAKALTVDGSVGPQTWPVLIITVEYGSTGWAVRGVQYLLVYKYNLLSSEMVDSHFGELTRSAVISFQAGKGLNQDGVVGPPTWNALISG